MLLDEATEASREAQEGLRVMIQDLTPPGLDQASLDETLRWLAEFFETRFGFQRGVARDRQTRNFPASGCG